MSDSGFEDPFGVFADAANSPTARRRAFEQIVKEMYSTLTRYARRIGGSRDRGGDEEDWVVDALVSFLDESGSGRPRNRAWLHTVVRNKVIDAVRKEARRVDRPIEDFDRLLGITSASDTPQHSRPAPVIRARIALLRRAIRMLPPFSRSLVVLHGLRGCPYDLLPARLLAQKRACAKPARDPTGWLRTAYMRALVRVHQNSQDLEATQTMVGREAAREARDDGSIRE